VIVLCLVVVVLVKVKGGFLVISELLCGLKAKKLHEISKLKSSNAEVVQMMENKVPQSLKDQQPFQV
jgi:hypothetical protein